MSKIIGYIYPEIESVTAFWQEGFGFRFDDILHSGITHWRIKEKGYSERVHEEEVKVYSGGDWQRRKSIS